ncbi:DUF1460 domain-containing protein [bacterium]|nr:DUF1460 domain-containing protein [bacterium]
MWRSIFLALLLAGCAAAPDIQTVGAAYLGVAYQSDPLGEGVGYDSDPLIRFDAFDCTTFVETVLARGDVDTLTQIRYAGGVADFVRRHHFMETDWLTHNADLVRPVSAHVAPTARRRVTIDRAAWLRRVHGMDNDAAPQTVDLEYIPYAAWPRGYRPTRPMVVMFVGDGDGMREKIGTDLAVTHMGFLMPDGMLRHASSRAGCVRDENFDDYVAARQNSRHNLGVMLLEIIK